MLTAYFTAFLETFAILTVIVLFTNIRVQERENLKLISRVRFLLFIHPCLIVCYYYLLLKIGNHKNTINQLYMFEIPSQMKEDDTSKIRLEISINNPGLDQAELDRKMAEQKKKLQSRRLSKVSQFLRRLSTGFKASA